MYSSKESKECDTHVFAQNKYCDEWNVFMLKSLLGDTSICVAHDSKKDNITDLANINIPDKPSATGNFIKGIKDKSRCQSDDCNKYRSQ